MSRPLPRIPAGPRMPAGNGPAAALRTLLRDLRDATGAALISGGIFGLPVLLAAMGGPVAPPALEVQASAGDQREAVYLATIPLPEATPEEDPAGAPAGAPEPVASEPAVAEAPASAPVPEDSAEPTEAPPATQSPALAAASAAEAAESVPPVPIKATPPTEAPAKAAAPDQPSELGAHGLRGPRVRVGADGRRHWVALYGTPELEALRESRERSAKARKKRRCEDGTDQIQAAGEGSFEVARDLVDYYVKDLKEAATLASVAWHKGPDGKRDGFRIRRISCGNVLHQAGFRNGDVVHSVNGKRIRTVLHAIGAYRKLKRKDHLRIEVTGRDGETRKMRYRIS